MSRLVSGRRAGYQLKKAMDCGRKALILDRATHTSVNAVNTLLGSKMYPSRLKVRLLLTFSRKLNWHAVARLNSQLRYFQGLVFKVPYLVKQL
jgi:hypothetical protein